MKAQLSDLEVGDFVLVNDELVGVVVNEYPLMARVHTDELFRLEEAETVELVLGNHGPTLKGHQPALKLVVNQ